MLADSASSTLASSTLVSRFPSEGCAWPTAGGDLRALLTELSGDWSAVRTIADRRLNSRAPCAYVARLTPLDENVDGGESPVSVQLTDISRRGVGLAHADPLPYRLVQIAVEGLTGSAPILVVRLQWCRFRKPGVYESGGQIQRIINEGL